MKNNYGHLLENLYNNVESVQSLMIDAEDLVNRLLENCNCDECLLRRKIYIETIGFYPGVL